jgi:hypothetical protein
MTSFYSCFDYLRIYTDLNQAGVNERTPWQGEYCATEIASQQIFYSKSHALFLQFHTGANPGENLKRGFRGQFRFLKRG